MLLELTFGRPLISKYDIIKYFSEHSNNITRRFRLFLHCPSIQFRFESLTCVDSSSDDSSSDASSSDDSSSHNSSLDYSSSGEVSGKFQGSFREGSGKFL